MLLRIYSPALVLIGVCDDYASVKITRRFRDSPSLLLRARQSPHVRELLCDGNLVTADGIDEAFLIDYVSYDDAGADSALAEITVQGRGVLAMLSRRCVKYRILHTGNLGALMQTLVMQAAPAMPGSVTCDVSALTTPVLFEQDYTDTVTALADLCKIFSAGMRMQFLPAAKSFVFSAFGETDRTVNQSVHLPVIYARERENVTDELYTQDSSRWRNIAYVYGSEDGAGSRYHVIVGDTTAADRRELFINAADLSVRRYETQLHDGTIVVDTAAYYAALRRRGEEVLAKYPIKRCFSVTLNPLTAEVPPLGSICTLQSRAWNISADAVLTEEEWTVENGIVGRSITLGSQFEG